MGFVFYDTETTGTDTAFDQILQFAAIHTDENLNERERFEIRCRLLPHIVPSPGAMRVTKVTVKHLTDTAYPTHYQMMQTIKTKLHSWSPSVFAGYNSLKFDEPLLRQAFYQTLHPIYLTNTLGNSRTDVLRILLATSLFAPEALTIPTGDKNRRVFKLDRLAPANGFAHEHAHDALADVEATIHMCRLVKERAPKVWASIMRFSTKAAVTDFALCEPIFSLSDFYYNVPHSWLVTALGVNPDNSSEILVFDLATDPDELAALSPEELIARFKQSPKPVRSMKTNACPILMAYEDAPVIANALALGKDELNRRVQRLRENDALRERLMAARKFIKEEQDEAPSEHVEKQIYAGFISPQDQRHLDAFHAAQWEERKGLVSQLSDQRLRTLMGRLIHCERPDLLEEAICKKTDLAIAKRLLADETTVPWLTLPKAIAEVESLLETAEGDEKTLLIEHREYLLDRLTDAYDILKSEANWVKSNDK